MNNLRENIMRKNIKNGDFLEVNAENIQYNRINGNFARNTILADDTVVDTTTAPSTNTRSRIVQTKVEKKVPKDVESAPETAEVVTSRRTFPNRKTKVVAVTTLVRENRVRVVLNGRRLRSFDA